MFKQHPKGIWLLSLSSLSLRFSFWGIGNLLVIYLIQYYHLSIIASTNIYAIFTGLSAFLPLMGGYLADRWNYQGPLFLGIGFATLGCYFLALGYQFFLFPALSFLLIGYSLYLPTSFAILNLLYKNKHALQEAGFTLYYSIFNIGVFLAMILIGILSRTLGWNSAFAITGTLQLVGFVPTYFFYKKFQAIAPLHPSLTAHEKKLPLKSFEKDRVLVILILSAISIFYWAAYTQGYSSISLFVMEKTNRFIAGWEIPTAWILSSATLFLIILCPLFTKFYNLLQKKHKNPSPPMKIAISLIVIALCFLVMTLISLQKETSFLYVLLALLFIALSEVLISPIGLALVTHLSPHRFTAFLVGVWYGCVGLGYYFGGSAAGLIATLPFKTFFFWIFLSVLVVAALMIIIAKKINAMRHMENEKIP